MNKRYFLNENEKISLKIQMHDKGFDILTIHADVETACRSEEEWKDFQDTINNFKPFKVNGKHLDSGDYFIKYFSSLEEALLFANSLEKHAGHIDVSVINEFTKHEFYPIKN
jgi:hypothetical protein